jgi:hypothetical protein
MRWVVPVSDFPMVNDPKRGAAILDGRVTMILGDAPYRTPSGAGNRAGVEE